MYKADADKYDMIRVGIVFGGRSGEHDVSLMSATSVIKTLVGTEHQIICIGITRQGEWKLFEGEVSDIESGNWERNAVAFNISNIKDYIDFAFPVLHGPFGEDGTIQGLFEMLDVPYAGAGVLASSLAMDKIVAKDIFAAHGIPICKHTSVMFEEFGDDDERLARCIEDKLFGKYPFFVKPANMGSSVGVTKAKDRGSLISALYEAARYDRRILIEEGLVVRELEVAMLGNIGAEASVVGEILPSEEFYSYSAKYFDGGKSKTIIPAKICHDVSDNIRQIAVKAYEALDCNGFARVDFFLEKETNKIYVNEINTIPGFTRYSMFPMLWQGSGLTYQWLLERIIQLGLKRYNARKAHANQAFNS